MSNDVFHIDCGKLIRWLVPQPLRQVRQLLWLRSLAWPLVVLFQEFARYRKAKLYELSITPQVCRLEALLNDRFDYTLRRIRIVDSLDKPPVYFYQDEENKPVWLDEITLYTDGESGDIKDDFIVQIPAALPPIETELLAVLKAFKLAGTRPKTQRI